ncbi:MAG: N-acyl homoserine lactonase family protein [Candidatus Methanomethyliaceae archaeon]
MAEYSIYALKYAGPFPRHTPLLIWFKDRDQVTAIGYFIWCIRGGDETVVVDAGVGPELARERALESYVSPAEVLLRLGVRADSVQHVILTHLHWDHADGASLFPNARFYIQQEEWDFWTRDPVARRPPFQHVSNARSRAYVESLADTERIVLLPGEAEIRPGIVCLPAPGHTPGLQAVAVETARGTAILGSDCAHIFRNYREDWPSALITDMRAWLRTYDYLRVRVSAPELLFPGHDLAMLTEYPQVAEDVSRLV